MVITMAEGLRVGRVYEVFIDRPAKRIMGISYKAGILGVDKEIYVDFADIHKFSRDVVIIAGRNVAGELPGGMNRNGLRRMRGYKVTTHEGKHVGEVSDLVLSREDGKIVEILLSDNRKLQLAMTQVVMGPDLILIPTGGESALAPADPEPNEFVSRLFGTATWSETFREGYQGVRGSLRNTIQSEKVMDSLKSGSERARDTVLRTSQFIQQAIDQMRKRPDSEAGRPQDEPEASPFPDVNTERTSGIADPIQDLGPEDPPRNEGTEPHRKEDPTS
jgi:sporulation protein YlmC with PRC-barrel domain